MRFKDLQKEMKDTEGVVYGVLRIGGFVSHEFRGRLIHYRQLYYEGRDGQEDFSTGDSDTLLLAWMVEGFLRAGGKLSEIGRGLRGTYKRYKFNRRDAQVRNRQRRFRRTGRYYRWNAHLRAGWWPVDAPNRPIIVPDLVPEQQLIDGLNDLSQSQLPAQVVAESVSE